MKQASKEQADVAAAVGSVCSLEEQHLFFLLVAYVLFAKYIHIRTADKCVLDSITDQHVSAASPCLINKLDNMVNNWSL